MVGGYTNNNYTVKLPTAANNQGAALTPTYGANIGTSPNTPLINNSLINNSKIPTSIYGNALGATVKMPDLSSQFNGNVVKPVYGSNIGGGTGGSGGVTKEGVIVGGGAVNSTFNNISSPKTPTTTTTPTYKDLIAAQQKTELVKPSTPTTSAPATSTPETSGEEAKQPASYEEYIKQTQEGYQAQLDAAKKEAERVKERAMIDAQSSYAQNKATYGANAETMAEMGLQGGGYSDYLNAQAYAQKRADVQQANAQEIASKTAAQSTYQEYVNNLNQQLANNLLYEERLKEQREYDNAQSEQSKKDSLYAQLWEGVQNADSGYTAAAIDDMAKQYGLSDEQATSLKNILASTQAKSAEDTSKKLLERAIVDIENNGTNLSDGYLDSIKQLGLSDADYSKAKEAYQKAAYKDYLDQVTSGTLSDTRMVDSAYTNGNLTQEQYNSLKKEWNSSIDASATFFSFEGGNLPYAEAQTALNAVLNNSWCTDDVKQKLQSAFIDTYAIDIGKEHLGGKVKDGANKVNVNSSSYSTKQWGDFDGIDKTSDWQYTYAQKVAEDAKAGKIAVGQVVTMNVGSVWSDYGCYVYVGNGVFVKCECSGWSDPKKTYGDKLYIPDGYKIGGANNSIQRK